jgi:hypothetical protein
MKGDLAVVELDGDTRAFRLGATGWQPAGQVGSVTEDIETDGQKVILSTGECAWAAWAAEPDGNGGWTRTILPGQPRDCDDEHWGGPVDLDGDRVMDPRARIEQARLPLTLEVGRRAVRLVAAAE